VEESVDGVYPVLCPMCEKHYYEWKVTKGVRYSLTGEYSEQVLETIEYIHDDGMVCSYKVGKDV
jgi:hypothetical protein